jgi:hypothetical protein
MRRGRLEIDSLRKATRDEREFHLSESDADAHPWTAAERHPGLASTRRTEMRPPR